jgi:hypothetical protein
LVGRSNGEGKAAVVERIADTKELRIRKYLTDAKLRAAQIRSETAVDSFFGE